MTKINVAIGLRLELVGLQQGVCSNPIVNVFFINLHTSFIFHSVPKKLNFKKLP